jgi:hypothetical protein
MRCVILAVTGLAAVMAASASAKRIQPNEQFNTIWFVEAADLPSEPVSIPPKGMVIKQRLLPVGLAKLTQAFSGAKPEEALSAGTELVQARGPDGSIYCSTRYRSPSFLAAALSSGPDQLRQICFLDADNDGVFEAAVPGISNLKTLPSAFGTLPKRTVPIAPLPYEKSDPTSFSEQYFVGIQYQGQAKIGTLRRFHVAFGSDGNWDQISDNLFTKRDSDLPKALEIMGAVVTIRGGEGKNVVATIEKMIPPQPFGVVVTTVTY